MPEPGKSPDHEHVKYHPAPAAAAASQGDIDIISKPAAQSHMPAPPEIRDRHGGIGVAEVPRDAESQNLTQTHSHEGVALKVKINLQGIGQSAQPGHGDRDRAHAPGLHLVPEHAECVRQQNLKAETADKCLQPVLKMMPSAPVLISQLPGNIAVENDGAGYQLREHAKVGSQIDEALLRLHILPVDIYRVGCDLECVKTDPDRQRYVRQVYPGQMDAGSVCCQIRGQLIPVALKKAAVFKNKKCSKAVEQHEEKAQSPAGPALPIGISCQRVVYKQGQKDQDKVHMFPVGIEKYAAQK